MADYDDEQYWAESPEVCLTLAKDLDLFVLKVFTVTYIIAQDTARPLSIIVRRAKAKWPRPQGPVARPSLPNFQNQGKVQEQAWSVDTKNFFSDPNSIIWTLYRFA